MGRYTLVNVPHDCLMFTLMKAAENIYTKWDEPQRGCLLAMRQIILSAHPHITETVKYGMPCFCYDGKHFCYLWADKTTHRPYLLMVEGLRMQHPLLVQGDRKRMKALDIDPDADLPLETIQEILEEGLALYE